MSHYKEIRSISYKGTQENTSVILPELHLIKEDDNKSAIARNYIS